MTVLQLGLDCWDNRFTLLRRKNWRNYPNLALNVVNPVAVCLSITLRVETNWQTDLSTKSSTKSLPYPGDELRSVFRDWKYSTELEMLDMILFYQICWSFDVDYRRRASKNKQRYRIPLLSQEYNAKKRPHQEEILTGVFNLNPGDNTH